ncbi:hypothetical protein C0J52_25917 [Blattella germanica]|nr:hypothetical protein C0J52_25917 [Blattella germanica]
MISSFISFKDGRLKMLYSFECGFGGFNNILGSFNIQFFMMLILFIIFDLEIVLFVGFIFLHVGVNSILFGVILMFISFFIMVFSSYYINGENKIVYFVMVLFVFLIRIYILIFSFTSLSILVFWDLLGISRFFLVYFYTNWDSLRGAIHTVMTNRVVGVIIHLSFSQQDARGRFKSVVLPVESRILCKFMSGLLYGDFFVPVIYMFIILVVFIFLIKLSFVELKTQFGVDWLPRLIRLFLGANFNLDNKGYRVLMIFRRFKKRGVAFITLCERHYLGGSHSRIGPNKTRLGGVLQAIFDGLKLVNKHQLVMQHTSFNIFLFPPIIVFLVIFCNWFVLRYVYEFFSFELSFLVFLCLAGINVYGFIIRGYFSFCKYSFLGALRARRQSISYEVVFSFCFISMFMLFFRSKFFTSFKIIFIVVLSIFFIVILADLNRIPFDFSEGESELVRGYNVEYGGVGFALLFIGEYGNLIFFASLISLIFFDLRLLILYVFFCSFVLIRSSYPRVRYDFIIGLF